MSAYYNEIDPYAAAWLRNLIAANLIPKGEVDERSIVEVEPADVADFRQCHFFAGIAGWGLAARLAGWPDDRELWTGSAPCQPFSVAGKQQGHDDDRHLWPHYFRLIEARRPAVLMGEQVAAAVGKHWLDGVHADLESIGYACGSAVVPACAVNAPHRRDRLWFVANAHGFTGGESDTHARGCEDGSGPREVAGLECAGDGAVADANLAVSSEERQQRGGELSGPGVNTWARHSWITGHDGKARRVEPSIRLLAHGVPARVGKLRAYGNAIVPQVAAEVIGAFMECRP